MDRFKKNIALTANCIIGIIILIQIFFSFLETDSAVPFARLPFYWGGWLLLFLLVFIYSILLIRKGGFLRFSVFHFYTVFFGLVIAVSFITTVKKDIELIEGVPADLKTLTDGMGIQLQTNTVLTLTDFFIEKYRKKNKSIKMYRSTLDIGSDKSVVIEVNKPYRIGPVTFYQKGWALGMSVLKFRFQDRVYDAMNQEYPANEEFQFNLRPFELDGADMVYQWRIKYADNQVEEGLISRNHPDVRLEKYGFSIEEEKYKRISTLICAYKPFHPALAGSAVLYILLLFFDLWGWQLFSKWFKKD